MRPERGRVMHPREMRPTLATTELGPVVAEFRRTLQKNVVTLAWLAPLLVGAVGLVVVLSFGFLEQLIHGWVRPAMIAGLLPAVFLLGTGVAYVIRNWDLHLALHRQGMVQTTWRADVHLRWDQVAELWMRGERDIKLKLHDGSEVVIDGVTWSDEPVQRIEALTLGHMLPGATEAIRRGGRLMFGPIAVSRKGMEVRGKPIPWRDVELRPGLHGGMLTIRDRGTNRMEFVSIRDVPNPHLLRAVLPDVELDE